MKEDYLSSIMKHTINKRVHFKLLDVRNSLIDDIDKIIYKLNCFNINTNIIEKEYIDVYSLILLIVLNTKALFILCSFK